MTGVGRPYRHPVHVALLVIEHGLGSDHAGDRVDGEDVVAVRVSVCTEKTKSGCPNGNIPREMDGQNCAWTIIPAVANLLNAGERDRKTLISVPSTPRIVYAK